MVVNNKAITFLFLIPATFFNLCHAESIITQHPQELKSFKIESTQTPNSCSYTVKIKTSCSSTPFTRDQISLSFGDAYGHQVHAPRIDNPRSRVFEKCSTDAFAITGPCMQRICYVYLYRTGSDGWKPETVEIYDSRSMGVSFAYNTFIPNGVWYGFNFCKGKPVISV